MENSDLEKAYSLLKEKYERHEKILIQAYKSLKDKEQKLLELNQELRKSKLELSITIEELRVTNEELSLANEEIKAHSENLDELVKQRSRKIEEQLNIFHEYAYLNSHEVRAPLARILGLVNLMEYDNDGAPAISLINKLKEAAKELDHVVGNMNRLLEKGSFPKDTEQVGLE